MNTYEIEFRGRTTTSVGETAGKAKYSFFNTELDDCGWEFGDFVRMAKCKLVHKFRVSDLFTKDIEGFNRTKERRDIEFAQLGMKVTVDGKSGVIVGDNSSLNLDVCFDGESWASNCHPWWRIKYFDNHGNLIKEYRD